MEAIISYVKSFIYKRLMKSPVINKTLYFDDLMCEGLMAVSEAKQSFDETKGCKFITHLWYILRLKVDNFISKIIKEESLYYLTEQDELPEDFINQESSSTEQQKKIRIPRFVSFANETIEDMADPSNGQQDYLDLVSEINNLSLLAREILMLTFNNPIDNLSDLKEFLLKKSYTLTQIDSSIKEIKRMFKERNN